MKTIRNDLKTGNLKKVYLVYGEEQYLIRNIKNQFVKTLVTSADNMNCSCFDGKGTEIKEVMNMCDTLPFFADRRLVILQNTGCVKTADEKFMKYLQESVPDTTCIVIIESDVDKRGKMYKLIKKDGYVCECTHPKALDLEKWILAQIGRENKKITKQVLDYFMAMAGNDMEKLSMELEKIFCYTINKDVIDKEDIDTICCPEINGKIFDMIDAMGLKKQKETLDLYYDLINTKEAPLKILYMISRQFNIMLQVKELVAKGYTKGDIAQKMSMSPYVIGGAMRQCHNFSSAEIANALKRALKTEEAIKTGCMEEKTGVEMLLIQFSN